MSLGFIFLALVFGLGFYYVSYRLLARHFHAIMSPLNQAGRIFFISILLGFGLALYNFNTFAQKIYELFLANNHAYKAIALYGLLIFICLAFCILMFRLVLFISKVTFKENEKAELVKGNLIISGFQSILFLFFITLLSDSVLRFIAIMIN